MRAHALLPLLFLVCGVAVASADDHKNAPPPGAERTPRQLGGDTGAARSTGMRASQPGEVETGAHAERRPTVQSGATIPDARPDPGLMMELAQKQMRRHKPTIDKCTKDAQKRAATGSIVLQLKVVDHKVVASAIKSETIKDAKLDACLLKTSKTWTFGVAETDFEWQVDL